MNKINTSEEAIKRLQEEFPYIRAVAGWRQEDLGNILNMHKQNIYNIEKKKIKLCIGNYIAIRYFYEQEAEKYRESDAVTYLSMIMVMEILVDRDNTDIFTKRLYHKAIKPPKTNRGKKDTQKTILSELNSYTKEAMEVIDWK